VPPSPSGDGLADKNFALDRRLRGGLPRRNPELPPSARNSEKRSRSSSSIPWPAGNAALSQPQRYPSAIR